MIDMVIVVIYLCLCTYLSQLIVRGWLQSSQHKLIYIKRALGCETDEQCAHIQRGHLWLKRLKQWLIMTSFGAFLFVSDVLNAMIRYIERLEQEARPGLLWRWSIGWFQDPEKSNQLIYIWKIYDSFETLVFIIFLFVATRWIYADARCRRGQFPNFHVLMGISVVINTCIYFALTYFWGSTINDLRLT